MFYQGYQKQRVFNYLVTEKKSEALLGTVKVLTEEFLHKLCPCFAIVFAQLGVIPRTRNKFVGISNAFFSTHPQCCLTFS